MEYGMIAIVNSKKGFIPNAIKWFTKSQFSHSLVVMPDILGTQLCIEAAEGGVDFTKWAKEYVNNVEEGYELWRVKVDPLAMDKALKCILNDLEMSYGYLSYPFFIYRRICAIFGKDVKSQNNWFKSDGMICSQLCMAYLNECKLDPSIFSGYGQGSIAPQDLHDIFTAHPETFELIETVRL